MQRPSDLGVRRPFAALDHLSLITYHLSSTLACRASRMAYRASYNLVEVYDLAYHRQPKISCPQRKSKTIIYVESLVHYW